jgi:hypothetical protein
MPYKFVRRKNVSPIETPCRKKIYHSAEEAQDMIRYINETRVSKEIHVYRCDICGFWHLTSRSK